jgi:hypothetical protein
VRSLRSSVFGLTLVAIAASGCGSTTESGKASSTQPGTVTGVASPCGSLATKAEYAQRAVQVLLSAHSKVVASETVTGTHIFKFTEPPGSYVLTSHQSYVHPVTVILHTGKTTQVNLYANCM